MTESSFEVQENFLLIGNKGSYLVEKFLGEGTFGKVAKCKNLSTNKEVAIKIIKNGFDNAGENELKALIEISKLDADEYNLVKCVDVFLYKSHVCIVFEILEQSLYDFLEDRRFRPLFVQEIRAIAWQLLIALKGLKSINLVHCDVKLDNIMLVNQDSKPFRVKLIDFGLASKTKDIPTGTRLQNICFRAPEVILGLPLDERLDMWTVGYVLALLYTEQQSKKTGNQVKDKVNCRRSLRPPNLNSLQPWWSTNRQKQKRSQVFLRDQQLILRKDPATTTRQAWFNSKKPEKERVQLPQEKGKIVTDRARTAKRVDKWRQQLKRKRDLRRLPIKHQERHPKEPGATPTPPAKLEIGEEYAYIEKSLGVPCRFYNPKFLQQFGH
uniref:Protein kinase domain-containing protein n=1 Tax=Oryzias latipes TaxID=8090 RepID=A0A3B3HRI1_ORYLA